MALISDTCCQPEDPRLVRLPLHALRPATTSGSSASARAHEPAIQPYAPVAVAGVAGEPEARGNELPQARLNRLGTKRLAAQTTTDWPGLRG